MRKALLAGALAVTAVALIAVGLASASGPTVRRAPRAAFTVAFPGVPHVFRTPSDGHTFACEPGGASAKYVALASRGSGIDYSVEVIPQRCSIGELAVELHSLRSWVAQHGHGALGAVLRRQGAWAIPYDTTTPGAPGAPGVRSVGTYFVRSDECVTVEWTDVARSAGHHHGAALPVPASARRFLASFRLR